MTRIESKNSAVIPHVIKPQCDRRATIDRLTSNIGGRFGWLVELIWNSVEWGRASRVDVRFGASKRDVEVLVLDNGVGMNSERRERLVSLAVTADASHRGRNYQDIGAKRAAHDFINCEVWTVCAEEQSGGQPICWRMAFLWDTLLKILAGDSQESILAEPIDRSDRAWKELNLPAKWTGTIIKLRGLREGRQRFTALGMQKRLSTDLPIWVAERVFINDEPLPPRDIIGTPLRFDSQHPTLGRLHVDLYVPKSPSSLDELRIGPFERVTSWATFLREVPEEMGLERFAIFDCGVYGDMHIEGLNPFVASSRREFDPALFSEDNHVLVESLNWLAHDVVPEVERLVGVVKEQATSDDDRDLTNRLKDLLQGLNPEEVPGHLPVLELDISQAELLPGAKLTVRVVKYEPDQRLVWNYAHSGGTARFSDENRQVEYTAGQGTGTFVLTCYYHGYPEGQVAVSLNIVPKKVLRIEPAQLTIGPRRQVTLRAVNHEDDSSGVENLRWRLDGQDLEGRFLITIDGKLQEREVGFGAEAVYRAGSKEDTFTVELYDQKQRTKVARAMITVAKPKSRERNKPDETIDFIGGIPYEFMVVHLAGSPVLTRLTSLGKRHQIRINLEHPVCKRTEKVMGREALLVLVANRIILHHISLLAEKNGEDLSPSTLVEQHAKLLATVADKIVLPSAK